MPWRLVSFILVFAVFLVFILSNLGNKCDISFINPDWTLKEVPVFITVFCSFIAGVVCSIPLIISAHFKAKKKNGSSGKLKKGGQKAGELPEENTTLDEAR
ncbi:MAG: hypothetical protein LBG73_03365 [Spirochaetaceae bacterium]|jgi:uncharacterized integral membrane protein|nr:hypothetical protein [Spirochaetaceae bacterium]